MLAWLLGSCPEGRLGGGLEQGVSDTCWWLVRWKEVLGGWAGSEGAQGCGEGGHIWSWHGPEAVTVPDDPFRHEPHWPGLTCGVWGMGVRAERTLQRGWRCEGWSWQLSSRSRGGHGCRRTSASTGVRGRGRGRGGTPQVLPCHADGCGTVPNTQETDRLEVLCLDVVGP